ncbi:preprotein translocase subunit SecE [Sulfolobus acidocaldarius]|nr:preprotein translocase subunit SecE [Sulfolobus acidocaldarius SUSAZ]ALU30372.1 preprotein translocase subunit SecE [Sulfolobus acidocaldarius]ALU31090.1 preprotein translocase subunit SecE [Sulfolobus acidocaldarius]
MKISDIIKRLREDWKRIISVAKKPDKDSFNYSIRLTLLVMAVVGLIAYIVQLTTSLIIR